MLVRWKCWRDSAHLQPVWLWEVTNISLYLQNEDTISLFETPPGECTWEQMSLCPQVPSITWWSLDLSDSHHLYTLYLDFSLRCKWRVISLLGKAGHSETPGGFARQLSDPCLHRAASGCRPNLKELTQEWLWHPNENLSAVNWFPFLSSPDFSPRPV